MSTYDPKQRPEQTTPAVEAPKSTPAPGGGMVQFLEATRVMNYPTGVQYLRPDGGAEQSVRPDVHDTAAAGVAGSGNALPHGSQIQDSFGGHDISGVQAHIGGPAAAASEAMGADAYATGDDVAFKGAPDLHTAAHEAAHVVQQRAGVQLKDGVGEAGDAYEQQADAVADRVVAGQPAADLLGKSGSDDDGGMAVQAYAGNVDLAHNAADGGATTINVRAERQALHGGDAGAYDANENPRLKVEFEIELARLLLVNRAFFMPVVEAVSRGVGLYLQAKAETLHAGERDAVKQVFEQACQRMTMMYGAIGAPEGSAFGKVLPDTFYGRLTELDSSDAGAVDRYYDSMRALIEEGSGNASNHLMLHASFNEYVKDDNEDHGVDHMPLLQKVAAKVAETEGLAEEQKAILSNAGGEAMAPGGLRDERYSGRPDAEGSIGDGRGARGRLKAKEVGKIEADQPGLLAGSTLSGPMAETRRGQMVGIADDATAQESEKRELTAEELEAGLGQKGSRGVEMYMLDESQAFIQQARLAYNMPLAAGISGTTTDLLEVAIMFGVASARDRFLYALACLAHLGSIGAHSFHEIMTSAKQANVAYEPGNYRSVLPSIPAGHPAAALFADPRFAAVPGIGPGASATAGPPAAAGDSGGGSSDTSGGG